MSTDRPTENSDGLKDDWPYDNEPTDEDLAKMVSKLNDPAEMVPLVEDVELAYGDDLDEDCDCDLCVYTGPEEEESTWESEGGRADPVESDEGES